MIQECIEVDSLEDEKYQSEEEASKCRKEHLRDFQRLETFGLKSILKLSIKKRKSN